MAGPQEVLQRRRQLVLFIGFDVHSSVSVCTFIAFHFRVDFPLSSAPQLFNFMKHETPAVPTDIADQHEHVTGVTAPVVISIKLDIDTSTYPLCYVQISRLMAQPIPDPKTPTPSLAQSSVRFPIRNLKPV